MPYTNPTEAIKEIVAELRRIYGPAEPLRESMKGSPFPCTLPSGDGKSIYSSQLIDQKIRSIGDELKKANPRLAGTISNSQYHAAIREFFGEKLIQIDLDEDIGVIGPDLLKHVGQRIAELPLSSSPRSHHFGCSLFREDVDRFEIGPVSFEPRLAWVKRTLKQNEISATTARRIESAWAGKKPAKRKASRDTDQEHGILRAFSDRSTVCTVSTSELIGETGTQKAAMAARLALMGIAIFWEQPSKALEGMNLQFDGPSYVRATLSSSHGKVGSGGWAKVKHPHGPEMHNSDWLSLMSDHRPYFIALGEALTYLLNPNQSGQRDDLMQALILALIWLHEASRETLPMLAVVKFASCLDTLSRGRMDWGILRLIKTQLGYDENDAFLVDGSTIKQIVSEIYREGRSRALHGTSQKSGHDWSNLASYAENLAHRSLAQSLHWVGSNPLARDPLEIAGK